MEFLISLVTLLALFDLSVSDTSVVYNTKAATSDLDWTLNPTFGAWEELSGLDLDKNAIRYHQVCNVNQPGQDNWARSPFINVKMAKRVYIDIEFSVMKCDECRETFTLYYYPSASDVASSTFPPWQEEPFRKIDTVAAGSRFDSSNAGPNGINKKTLAIGPLDRPGLYIAIQDQGACMSLISMKLYYHYCPEVTHNLAYFPKTVAGGDLASLIKVDGKCVSNAIYANNEVPKYWCNSNGEWRVPSGTCRCRAGYTPSLDNSSCRACPSGYYKSRSGNHQCSKCPPRSLANSAASPSCACSYGYFRMPTESIDTPCSRPPTAPRSLTYTHNKTSVQLNWLPPSVKGHREDIFYSISCQDCDSSFVKCAPCPPSFNIDVSDPTHVTVTSVSVSGLQDLSYYSLTVTSHNGVSSISHKPPAVANIRFSMGQNLPSPVTNVDLVSSNDHSLTLKWSALSRSNVKTLKYEVKVQRSGASGHSIPTLHLVSTRNITLTDLSPSTGYRIQVRALSSTVKGRYSDAVTFTTSPAPLVGNSEPIEHEGSPIIFIVIGCVAGLLALIAIAAFVLYRKRRQKKKEDDRLKFKLADSEVALLTAGNLKSTIPGSNARKTYVDYRDPHQGVKEVACEIDQSKVAIDHVIGQGEFGEVCRGRLTEGKKSSVVAIKRLRHGASLLDQTNFLREACTMAQFNDPNIVQFKGVVTKHVPAMIISEFLENGSLDRFLQKKKGELSLIQLVEMLRGIASGMRYLSIMKYIHRDLAARNILVDSDLVCKVSDFGLSRNLENDPHATYTTQGGKIALRWTAPECIRHRKFTSSSDVWSFGIVMWEVMSYGEKPYWEMSNNEVTQVIEDGYRLPSPIDCPQILHNLMLSCWAYEERKRPTFHDIHAQLEKIIRHPHLLHDPVEMIDLSSPLLSPDSPTSIQEVSTLDQWLYMVKLDRYRNSFYERGITDLASLARISSSELERLGISSSEHQSRLRTGIDTLRRHLSSSHNVQGAIGLSNTLRLPSEAPSGPSPVPHSFTLPPQQEMRQPRSSREVALV